MQNKLNILLITVDQMRGDCVEKIGKRNVNTPYLNTLCNEGVFFDRAYSATPSCIPARAALLTGLSQTNHKRVGYRDFIPWDYEKTMPQCFTDNGYQTRCIGKMHVWPPRNRVGFQEVELCDGYLPHRNINVDRKYAWERVDDYSRFLKEQEGSNADFTSNGVDCNSFVVREWNYQESSHPTNWATTQTIEFFKKRDTTKPFFLHLSYYAPHPPYTPPKCFLELYRDSDLEKDLKSNPLEPNQPSYNSFRGVLTKSQMLDLMKGYYGSITHIDHQIGRLLRVMRDDDLLNDTVILFTSDHGEMLGDKNLFRKYFAYEGSSNIPFIIADFGNNLNLDKGKKIDEIVELRDVFATLCGAAGLHHDSDGKDLVACLKTGEEVRSHLHGEHTNMEDESTSVQFIVTKKFKYIWNSLGGKEELYDMEHDRDEDFDLSKNANFKATLEKLRKTLAQELKGREEGHSDGENLFPGKKPSVMLSK